MLYQLSHVRTVPYDSSRGRRRPPTGRAAGLLCRVSRSRSNAVAMPGPDGCPAKILTDRQPTVAGTR